MVNIFKQEFWYRSNTWQKIASLVISVVIIAVIIILSLPGAPVIPNDTWWTELCTATTITQSIENNTGWYRQGEFSSFSEVDNGRLFLDTRAKPWAYLINSGLDWDPGKGITLEIAMKTIATPTADINGFIISILDGVNEGKISFRRDKLIIIDNNEEILQKDLDTTSLHIYRLTLKKGIFYVYVDGNEFGNIKLKYNVTVKAIQLGDFSSLPNTDMAATIDYLAYYLGDIVPPGKVPGE